MRMSRGFMASLAALAASAGPGHMLPVIPRSNYGYGHIPTDAPRSFPKHKSARVGVAAQKREAKKRRNIRAHSSKRKAA